MDDSTKNRADARKKSVYLPSGVLADMQGEAQRLERSLSWVIHRAWMLSRQAIENLPDQAADPRAG